MAKKDPIEECLNALNALFVGTTDNSVKAKANEWLMDFQKKREAWKVCDQILTRGQLPEQAYYFAANTLRMKVLYDFAELPDAKTRAQFRDALLAHITRFKAGPQTVRLRLALCLATLVAHMTGEWKDSLTELTQTFGKRDSALAYFDILTVIPEECDNKRLVITYQRRQEAIKSIQSFAPRVMPLLYSYLQSTGSDRDLQKRVFNCFMSWIRQGIPPNDIIKHPLFNAAFVALKVPELFETSCEVINEVMRQTEEVSKHGEVVKEMVQRVLQLVPLFEKYQKEKNDECCQTLGLVFCELGESYIRWILQGSPVAQKCIEAILICTAHPNKTISSNTFNFWYMLMEEMGRMGDREQDIFRTKFGAYFARVVDHLRTVVRYPPEYATWDPDTKEKSKRYRYFAADTLLDCASVIGASRCLAQIHKALLQEIEIFVKNNEAWHGVEACLYCVRSIARKVDAKESTVIPKVMEMLPKFAQNVNLRYTSTLIVGRYSEWLKENTKYINPLLGFVVKGLNDPEVSPSAAQAFKFVCESCATYLAKECIDQLFAAVYNKSRLLTATNRIQIIEGMAHVISALPPEKVRQYQMKLVEPLAQDLHSVLKISATGSASEASAADEQVSPCLDRLAESFRSLKPEDNDDPDAIAKSTVEVLSNLWKLFEQTLTRYKSDSNKMEKLSRCYRYSIRQSKLFFKKLLSPFVQLLTAFYKQHPHPSALYLVSICTDEFGSYPDYHKVLAGLLHEFTSRTFLVLKDAKSLIDHPDFTEDYFEMVNRYLKRCPDLVFTAPLLPAIVQCGLQGLQLHHRESCSAIMTFFATLITYGIDHPRENLQRPGRKKPSEGHVKVLNSLLSQYGQALVSGLIGAIAGGVPPTRVQYVEKVIAAVIGFGKDKTQLLFSLALKQPTIEVNEKIKIEFLRALMASGGDPKKIRDAVYQFSGVCRDNEN